MNLKLQMTAKNIAWITALAIAAIMPLAFNIQSLMHGCIHAVDFSIYQQAIYDIAAGISWNPYLTIRGVHVFADHFDPILILAAPFTRLTNYSPYSLLVFEYFWYLVTFLFILKTKKKGVLLALTLVVLSKPLLMAFLYPIHPSTWSLLPIFGLVYFIKKENRTGIISMAFILCLFKEVFPFAVFTLGMYYAIKKNIKTAAPLVGIASAFLIFIFLIRPDLMGETVNYAGMAKRSIWTILTEFTYLATIKSLYPMLVPLFFLFKWEIWKSKDWSDHYIIPTLVFALTLFGLHYIPNRFGMHKEVIVFGPLLAGIIYSQTLDKISNNKKLLSITLALFLASSIGRYTKMFNQLAFGKTKKCVISQEKRDQTRAVIQAFENNFKPDQKVLGTGGIVPHIVKPGREIYQSGFFFEAKADFDYLTLERQNSGDTTPHSKEKIEEQISLCKQAGIKPLYESSYFYLTKTNFQEKCPSITK